MSKTAEPCLCGSGRPYEACCGRHIDGGETAADAEALMRSRYTAYASGRKDYLLSSWHPSTRPDASPLEDGQPVKWIGLEVRRHERLGPEHATVEFVARYKVGGRAHRMRETSRFVREDGVWFYVDGDVG